MNLREDIKQLSTGPKAWRQFGLLVGGVFAILGVFFWLRHKAHYPYFLWPGLGLMILGTVLPRSLKLIYLVWMTLAVVLGFIMPHVILTLFFYLIITPVGLLARLFGKDFLGLKLDKAATSCWIRRTQAPKSAADYERQF